MGTIERIENEVILNGRENNQCWLDAAAAVVPPDGPGQTPGVIVESMQLVGNDIGPRHYLWTKDLGKTWLPPFESLRVSKNRLEDDVFEMPWLRPFYHRSTRALMAFGHTCCVVDDRPVADNRFKCERLVHEMQHQSNTGYTVWRDEWQDFEAWETVTLPEGWPRVALYPVQTHELPDGSIICPFHVCLQDRFHKAGTVRLTFDGRHLSYAEIGNLLGDESMSGGLCEPSIVEFSGRCLLTLRSEYGVPENNHDGKMYHAVSDDGLHWNEVEPWRWDDGSVVETEQTQQHWLKHGDTLFLTYTRKSERSNGVFRSRAPLWIARVNPDGLTLIRDTEQVLAPENGARMSNWCVANVTDDQAWVIVDEWLQQRVPGCEEGMRFWDNLNNNGVVYNRMQYLGNLLLVRVHFA